MLIAAFSGGKDSTAMVLHMADSGEQFECLYTPTGNELPGVIDHIHRVTEAIGMPLVELDARPLDFWIDHYGAIPNWRQRWCTRLIKIEPCIRYLKTLEDPILCVGLRADEPERQGLYGDFATYRYPLREAGFNLRGVVSYTKRRGMSPPARTDCAVCYGQRLYEWHNLLRDFPEEYAKGEAWEKMTGHTFRSPARDTWPASLVELRQRFEKGYSPRGAIIQLKLFDDDLDFDEGACRVCRM